jgi:PAS domain S-box-containing protein
MIAHMARRHPAKQSDLVADSGQPETLEGMREKLRRYELIFRATRDVLYDLKLEDGSVEWNEALYTQYGYAPDEPAGTLEWWTGHVHPDDALLLEHRISDIFESGTGSWQHDYRFRRADGGYNYVHDRGLVLRDGAGKPTRIIGSLLDVTAQTQLDIAKDEFIALVSHQLRTPLTVIRVYGEMLTSGAFGNLSEEQARWVRNMTSSSVRLIDVVGAILNISRIDLGRIKIAASPQDLVRLTREGVKEVALLAEEKRIRITLSLPDKLPAVNVDETIYTQTLHNLLTNAISYTQPQKGEVTVELKRAPEGYMLSVRDNGIGIPQYARTHIFERFYRAKNAVGAEAQGSGLGLYLVKVMTDAYGGRLWFESSEGKGTVFYVLIPEAGMVLV